MRAVVVRSPLVRIIDRLAASFLLALMALGSFALWIAVPAVCLYASARVAHYAWKSSPALFSWHEQGR